MPASTLADTVSEQVEKKSAAARYLAEEEEMELECFVINAAEIGYNYTQQDVSGSSLLERYTY